MCVVSVLSRGQGNVSACWNCICYSLSSCMTVQCIENMLCAVWKQFTIKMILYSIPQDDIHFYRWSWGVYTLGKDWPRCVIHAFRYFIVLLAEQRNCQDKMDLGAHPSCAMTHKYLVCLLTIAHFSSKHTSFCRNPRMSFFNIFQTLSESNLSNARDRAVVPLIFASLAL